jgi:hypothetical protein
MRDKIKRIIADDAVRLGLLMFVNYGLNSLSFRMLAKASYIGVGTTDALIAWWGFTMVRRIGEASTKRAQIGYTIGGIAGSLLGLWMDVHIFHVGK